MSVAEREAASAIIATRVNAILVQNPPGVLALYAAKGSEVDTAPIDAAAREAGWRVAYPRVTEDRVLAFHAVALDELVPAAMDLREPPATSPQVTPDVFVVPGLAFDREGGRVGWGRGHYDATLANAPRALRIGVAFEAQMVPRVASEPHDVEMHVVLTERGVYGAA